MRKGCGPTSNSSTDPRRRIVGSFGKAHGLNGEVKFYPRIDSDFFTVGLSLIVDGETLRIRSVRRHHDQLLIAFDEVRDRNGAEAFRNLEASTDAPPGLSIDEYWLEDLVGLQVSDTAGEDHGVVESAIAGPGQARLAIRSERASFEIPFVADLVPEVDLEAGRLVIDPPDGLVPPAS